MLCLPGISKCVRSSDAVKFSPTRFIQPSVISTYGFSFRFSTSTTVSCSANGAESRIAVTYCDDSPLTSVFPFVIGPSTVNGHRPNDASVFTPSFSSAESRCAIGRERSDSSPSNDTGNGRSAASPAKILMEVPEFAISTTPVG